jgi:hypothetical protein
MTFRANKAGTWVGGDDQSAGTTVYGKLGGSWLYAKEVFAKKDGVWSRAWTDCRQHDASGGRDWSSSSSTVNTSCGSCGGCGTTTKDVTTVTYTKTGCPTYTRTSETACTSCGSWSASTGNFTEGGVTYQYDGPAGYYSTGGPFAATPPGCSACPADCYRYAYYYIENCSAGGRRGTTTPLSCDTCYTLTFDPC